ncbi:hypothetical protein ACFC1B_07390 [Streptomyces xiamenensis]|uniref:hypothetical protein n=1 Tax=Streptomyces xiamenensis TaxID=408015 RepID=UPI0035DD287D
MTKMMRMGAAVGAAGLLTVLAACTSGASSDWDGLAKGVGTVEDPRGEAASYPSINQAEAVAVLAGCNDAAERAYKDLDVTILEEVVGGSLLQRSAAEIARFASQPEADSEAIVDRQYTDPRIIIPGSGGRWWMADVAVVSDGSRQLLTFSEGEEGQWLLVSAITLDAELPAIAVDERGFARIAPDDDLSGRFMPRDAVAAYQDLWETGGEGPGSPLATTPGGQEVLELRTPADQLLVARYASTAPEHTDSWTLRTEEGGTVTVGHFAHTETITGFRVPGPVPPGGDPEPHNPLITHHTGELAMWIPAAESPEILGAQWSAIGVG